MAIRSENIYWCVELIGGYELTGTLDHIDGKIETIWLEDGTSLCVSSLMSPYPVGDDRHRQLLRLILPGIQKHCGATLAWAAEQAYDRLDRPEYA